MGKVSETLYGGDDHSDDDNHHGSGGSGFGTEDHLRGKRDIILDSGQNIEMTNVPEGIKLTINDLRFVADSDQLLPEENIRLGKIAEILQTIPDRFILIEGHTAAVGNPNGEMELSVRRAKKITDELGARGIAPDRFIYRGWGGTKPIGDNNTDEGRRLNRRVEITIME